MYGKAPIGTVSISGWRQRATAYDGERKKTMERKSFTGSRFSNQFTPPEGQSTLVRFVPGDYKTPRPVKLEGGKFGVVNDSTPFYYAVMHKDWVMYGSTICSAGPLGSIKGQGQDCIACAAYYNTPYIEGQGRKGRFDRRETYIYNVYEYGKFYLVESRDKHGVVRVNPKTGKPYTEWTAAYNLQQDAIIVKEKDGHLQHFPVGYNMTNTIMYYDSQIGRGCRNCGAANSISRSAILCPHCGDALVESATTNMPLKDQEAMLGKVCTCAYCKKEGIPTEYIECNNCSEPLRSTIFDVDVYIERRKDTKGWGLILSNWSAPHALDPNLKIRPLDLVGMYAPDSLEVQEARYRMTMDEARHYVPTM